MMQFMRHASVHLQDDLAEPLTFIYFDIENFKSFNQRYGFQQGNRLLRYVADLLRETFEGKLVARFNDDHFAVATNGKDHADAIQFIHERIHVYDLGLPMEVKAGIYCPNADAADIALIMDRARSPAATSRIRTISRGRSSIPRWRRKSISAATSSVRFGG